MTGVSYALPSPNPSAVQATAAVALEYDAAGNRRKMTDGQGSVHYRYDALSRLSSETRIFNNLTGPSTVPDTTITGGYKLSYEYTTGGGLKKITNPWGNEVSYVYNKAGQVTEVGGASVQGPSGTITKYAQALSYRAWGALKSVTYGNSRQLSMGYDTRLRATEWNLGGVMRWQYNYDLFGEHTGRVMYAKNLTDPTLDRSYDYDGVGRLVSSHTGAEARAHMELPGSAWGTLDGPYSHNYFYDVYGNMTNRLGWGGWNAQYPAAVTYVNNKHPNYTYDAAGNLKGDGTQSYLYDVTGRQVGASYAGYVQTQHRDGDGLLVRKVESGSEHFSLRSSVLGGKVVAVIDGNAPTRGAWQRGHVYLGAQELATQYSGTVYWVSQDPVTKSQRLTDPAGVTQSSVDLDPWGGETARSYNHTLQPWRYTTYERAGNGGDDAMMRSYHGFYARFEQPDPYDGSYVLTDPQSFNRYSYTQNDPVNFVDPTGLNLSSSAWDRFNGPWDGWEAVSGGGGGSGVGAGGYGVNGAPLLPGFNTFYFWNGEEYDSLTIHSSGTPNDTSGPFTNASDKLKNNELPNPDDWNLDDCHKKGEALNDVFKSVRRRRVELDPDSDSYLGHVNTWAHQKNVLNKFISKFKGSDCGDDDLPPGTGMKEVEFEAGAKAPQIRNTRDFMRRGGAVPLGVGIITGGILLAPWLFPTVPVIQTAPKTVPAN